MESALDTFYENASKYRLLSRDEEKTASKETLVISNMRLVMKIAAGSKYKNRGLDYEDLVSEGMFGLIRASEKYVWRPDCKFSTYASFWIKSFIGRAISNKGAAIRIPAAHAQQNFEYARVTSSLDETFGGEDESSLYDVCPDLQTKSAEDIVCEKDAAESIHRAAEKLTEREREILFRSNGVGYDKKQSLAQIGRECGLCKERVRQIRNEANLKMRTIIGDDREAYCA